MSTKTVMKTPAEMFHLAEFIEEEIKERGWSLRDLVMNMGPFASEKDWAITLLAWEMFMEVRETYVILGDEMATELGRAFNVSGETFTNIHEGWRAAAIAKERATHED